MNRFRIIEKGLCCDVYYDKSLKEHKLALFLYGFPATIGENELTGELVKRGYMVLQPHYYGTYDSEGDFTPDSAFRSVNSIIDITRKSVVTNLKSNQITTIPQKISLCIGYSFGAYVLRHSLNQLIDVENVLLFSPVMSNCPQNQLCWANENALEHLQYVLRTRPYTYRIKDTSMWINKYVNDEMASCSLQNYNVKKVAWIIGSKDDTIIKPVIIDRHEKVAHDLINPNAESKLIIVENGAHGINSLVNDNLMQQLDAFMGL